jgi:hypothetical protein
MKIKPAAVSAFISIAVAFAITLSPGELRANTIALSFTGGSTFTPSDATAGWAFSLSTSVFVTDLGVWDAPSLGEGNFIGDGLSQSHLVTIWDNTTMTALAQATVNGGTLVNDFRYVSLTTPVLLGPGDYTIGAYYSAGGSDAVAILASTITTASGVTYDNSRFAPGNTFPPAALVAVNSYFGPNFQFIEAPPTNGTSVPDSGNTLLLMFGSVGALIGLRRILPAIHD